MASIGPLGAILDRSHKIVVRSVLPMSRMPNGAGLRLA